MSADILETETPQLQRLMLTKPNYVPPLNFSLVEDGIYRSGFPMPVNRPFLEQLNLKTIIYLGDLGAEKPKKKDKRDKKDKDKEKKAKAKENLECADQKRGVNGDSTIDDENEPEAKEHKPKKDKHGTIEILENYRSWILSTDIKFHHLVVQSSQEPFTLNTQEEAQASYVEALNLMLDRRNFPMLIHSNKGKHRVGVLIGIMRKIFQGWCMSGIFEEYEKFAMGKSEYDLEFIELWQPDLVYDPKSIPDFVRL